MMKEEEKAQRAVMKEEEKAARKKAAREESGSARGSAGNAEKERLESVGMSSSSGLNRNQRLGWMHRVLRRVAIDNLRGKDLKTENECVEIASTRLAAHNARCALRGESTDGNRAVVYKKLPLYTSKSGSSQSCAQAAVRQLNAERGRDGRRDAMLCAS